MAPSPRASASLGRVRLCCLVASALLPVASASASGQLQPEATTQCAPACRSLSCDNDAFETTTRHLTDRDDKEALPAARLCAGCDATAACHPAAPYFPSTLHDATAPCLINGQPCIAPRHAFRDPCNDEYAGGLLAEASVPPPAPGAFDGRRVAVLVTGEAFRKPCEETAQGCEQESLRNSSVGISGPSAGASSYRAQRAATSSLRDQVLRPLQSLGAHVEVVATFPRALPVVERREPAMEPAASALLPATPPARNASLGEEASSTTARLQASMRRWLAPWPVAFWLVASHDQDDGLAKAFLHLRAREIAAGVPYDYVLQLRHDLLVRQPLSAWTANLSKMAFASQGAIACVDRGCSSVRAFDRSCPAKRCVGDYAMWIPRRFVALASSVAQSARCAEHAFSTAFVTLGRASGLASEADVDFLVPSSQVIENVLDVVRAGKPSIGGRPPY